MNGYTSIHFPRDYERTVGRVLFHAGTKFSFRPGLNLIVGDQGVGKSTVLGILRAWARPAERPVFDKARAAGVEVTHEGRSPLFAFDFEKDNPRLARGFEDSPMPLMAQLAFRYMSHGQFVQVMRDNLRDLKGPAVIVEDEPETGLSPRSVRRLARIYAETASDEVQIIASTHHPYLIASTHEVLSIEHGRWMPSDDFLRSHEDNK